MSDYTSKPIKAQELAELIVRHAPQRMAAPEEETPIPETPKAVEEALGESVFDLQDLLERTENDEELAREIIEIFLVDTPVQIANLRKNLEDEKIADLSREAHSIKGSAASIGAPAIREVAFQIESAFKRGGLGDIPPLLNRLDREFERLVQHLKESGYAPAGDA